MVAVMAVTGALLEMSVFRPGRGTADRRLVRHQSSTLMAGMVRAIIRKATVIEIVEAQDAVAARLAAPISIHIYRATTETLHAEMTAMLNAVTIVAVVMIGMTDDMIGTGGADPTTTNGLGTAGRGVGVGHQSGTETEIEIEIATCTADRKTDHLALVNGVGTSNAVVTTTANTVHHNLNLVSQMTVGGVVVARLGRAHITHVHICHVQIDRADIRDIRRISWSSGTQTFDPGI